MAGDQWKDAIRRNYSFFKNNIADPLDVVEYLYGETDPPILNENLKDQIKVEGTTSKKVGKMLDILMRRGPRVPQFLYQAFVETENPDCAEKLAPYLLLQEKEALKKDPSEWPPPKKEHRAMEKEPVTYLRPNDPCCCLQYNNTDEEIEDKTRLISQSDKVKDSDCFIFIILTHGGDEGVFGVDEKSVSVSTLTEMFEPNNCPGLNEKPKIFLIQACRGEKKEMVDPVGGSGNVDPVGGSGKSHADGDGRKEHVDTVDGPNVKSEPNISATKTVHSKSDFLIAYSTPEGSLSWRKTDAGSWFIQAIVWIFKYEAHLKDLVEMLGKVNNLVSKGHADHGGTHYVTISNYQSSLRKKLYFFPGIYGEKRVHPNIR
ncbi:caspase-2-like isoform X2 [Ostrea edulis]|uniref:caspase-2-like isoform X2 n=1 Tax=Ostrea edulis TaxID=37623 RepID=UPI0024AF4F65|nr:caspase-2-like isoform X2 [Ostrea edulis]